MADPGHLTPTEASRLLEAHDLAPRRADGQHFVVDANTVDKIVAAAGLDPDDAVLEIGPGLGSLTIPLARVARRVVAVEIDSGLVTALRERLRGPDAPEGVEVHHADALRVDLAELTDEPLRLVANLPYSVATPLVMRMVRHRLVEDAFVMVQREVGERWAAAPGEAAYGAPTVKLALLVDVEVAFGVPRTVFLPPPHVDSVMVRLTPRPDAPPLDEVTAVAEVVDTAFTKRRKTLRNSLAALADKSVVVAACRDAGIDPSRRPERLSAGDFRRLTAALSGRA